MLKVRKIDIFGFCQYFRCANSRKRQFQGRFSGTSSEQNPLFLASTGPRFNGHAFFLWREYRPVGLFLTDKLV